MSPAAALEGGSEAFVFDFGVRLGMVFIIQSALLSAIAVSSLLIYIAYAALNRRSSRNWTVSSHIHLYFVNLLLSDLIQAIGGILDIQWVIDARVTEGSLCTTQGIFKQMGDVGVALTSLAIALHTFFTLVFRWQMRRRTAIIVLVVIWIFIALVIGVGVATHKGEDYYGNTQYWCWITGDYAVERIALEYVWLWLTALVDIVCYVVIALVISGVVIVDTRGMRFAGAEQKQMQSKVANSVRSEGSKRSKAVAMQMLFYPAIYVITVLPIAVVRFMAFHGSTVPFAATAFSSVLFSSSGFFNVLLFGLTRPRLVPSRDTNLTSGVQSSNGANSTRYSRAFPTDASHYELEKWKDTSSITSSPRIPVTPLPQTYSTPTSLRRVV